MPPPEVAMKIYRLQEEQQNLSFLLKNGNLPEEFRVVLERLLQSTNEQLANLTGTSSIPEES